MKKTIYTLVILSMLIAAFGVQGVGVQTASAAWSFNDNGTLVTNTPLPEFMALDPTAGSVNAGGNQGGCSAVAVFGAYQLHLLSNDSIGVDHFVRVRMVSNTDTGSYQWAVLVRDAATNIELGCQIAVAGVVDMTIPVDAGVNVIVTYANIGFYVPTDTFVDAYVARNRNGAGIIVAMRSDADGPFQRRVEASDTASDDFYVAAFDITNDNVAFLDVPDGTYNLGIQDQTPNAEIATYYPGVSAPGFMFLTPYNDADIPLTVKFNTIGVINPFVAVTPNVFGLNSDLEVGQMGVAPEAVNEKTFAVNPGYLWDFTMYRDSAAGINNIFMFHQAFNPTLGTLIWEDLIPTPQPFSWVDLCADVDYDDGDTILDPAGQLEAHAFDWDADNTGSCPAGYMGGRFLLSPASVDSPSYEVSTLALFENGWLYEYEPVGGTTWTLDPVDQADPLLPPSATFIIGDAPFLTTPVPNATSAEIYTLPLAAGQVALLRGPWTDQDLNVLVGITNVIPDPDVEISPEYWIEDVSTGWETTARAADWLTTDLGPITEVGRYNYWRGLEHGDLSAIFGGAGAGWFEYDDYFAIQPADMSMMSEWSWSWVMAMYEYDLTNGLNSGGFAPEGTVTRAQMAAFLSRVMDMFLVPPTGLAPAFSDVPAAFWASAEIAHLRDYDITTGTDWCNGVAVTNTFCPNALVTRAEMAKFIETTFRTIKVIGGVDFYWPEQQNIFIHGLTFIDVPVDYWANVWIEEFFFDQLTDGCGRDGLTLYYCPNDTVTRGQMAKFIIRAIQPDFITQGFWPILAPSK